MFEHEEKKLRELGGELEKISIPSKQLEEAIQTGFNIAEWELKKKRQKRRQSFWSIGIAAVLLLTFVTSIRISPAFANAVASIPGMEKFVEMMENDKSIQAIVDHEYYQPINISQTKDDLIFTINGVILDETGMVVSYTLEGAYSIDEMGYGRTDILHNGEEIIGYSQTYNYSKSNHKNYQKDIFKYPFVEKMSFETQDFVLEIELENEQKTVFSIPFTVEKEVKSGQVYTLNEEVEIESQKIIIEDVTISPLRTEVRLKLEEMNTMKLFLFEDMRIEDDRGEVWGRNVERELGRNFGGTEPIIYLQSNYFEEPKELYLKFNKIQALNKEETYLLIDVEKKEVLQQPSVGGVEVVAVNPDYIEIRFPLEGNETGIAVDEYKQTMWEADGYGYNRISIEGADLNSPLKIDFFRYPNYIEKEVSIKIK